MQIDVREIDDVTVDTINFGEDESLSIGDIEDDIFYVKSTEKSVPIYKDSIPNMIKALEKAQELWRISE